jgi:hypothetical protein
MAAARRLAMRSTCVAFALTLSIAACAAETDRTGSQFQTVPDAGNPYRVVIEFGSYGSGIDDDAYDDVVAYVGAHDIDLSPHVYPWGREGEMNLCFTLHGLNAQAQANFVNDVDAIAQGGFLTKVYENVTCNLIPN